MAHSTSSFDSASALETLLAQSSHGMQSDGQQRPRACCCGQDQCAYLEQNDVVLKGLEQDLQSAAQIGQALLVRHEAYLADSEAERRRMGATVEALESEKEELEISNASAIRDNRRLLDELEGLNGSVATSEDEIVSLTATLQSTMQQVDRLTALAAQASRLEAQLANLEAEHAGLQKKFISKEQGEKSANQRWKRAEVTISALQDQIERIEKEAAEERERHAEVLSRFERRRDVENELQSVAAKSRDTSAGGLVDQSEGSTSVITDFVKETLQDNANLQMGIVELRDMLMASNEEVENLREQLLLHQPVSDREDANAPTESLDRELAKAPGNESRPDFHVHHHYHAAAKPAAGSEKVSAHRKTKKRRSIPSSNSRVSMSTPRSNGLQHDQTPATNTILDQTSVTIPTSNRPSHIHKWSMSQAPSSAAASSLPSSPIFDRIDDYLDLSRPTTPGSTIGSPTFTPRHLKRDSEFSLLSGPEPVRFGSHEPTSISSVLNTLGHTAQDEEDESEPAFLEHSTILEQSEEPLESIPTNGEKPDATQNEAPEFSLARPIRPTLHRPSSHESILSSRGVALPKFRSRPSPRIVSNPRPTLATANSATGPITSGTWATAQRSKAVRRYDSSSYNKTLLAGAMSTSPPSSASKPSPSTSLSQRVGGWIAGRWGIAPDLSAGLTSPTGPQSKKRDTSGSNVGSKEMATTETGATPEAGSDGGSVRKTQATARRKREGIISTHLEPTQLNEDLLRDTLGEEDLKTTIPEEAVPSKTSNMSDLQQILNNNQPHPKDPKPSIKQPQKAELQRPPQRRQRPQVEPVTVDSTLLAESLGEI